MTTDSNDLLTQLQALPPEERSRLLAQLSGTDAAPADATPAGQTTMHVTIDVDGRVDGQVVGINLGKMIRGRDPEEDERRRLAWYLDALAGKLGRLPLRGISPQLEQGEGLSLPQVYVSLATRRLKFVVDSEDGGFSLYVTDRVKDEIRSKTPDIGSLHSIVASEFHPDWVLPTKAITAVSADTRMSSGTVLILHRQALATEAVDLQPRLVLLGDPGSGKSTFLRHLAWALALRGLDQLSDDTALFGWSDDRRLLPILLPLRKLAGRIFTGGASALTVYTALRDEMTGYCMHNVEDLLTESLHRGAALVLLDGLDEVPRDGAQDAADRLTTLQAVREFAQMHDKVHIVLTCRSRAFDDDLRKELGWEVETIAPFTLGQVRHFVPAFYRELVRTGQLDAGQAERYGPELVDTIVARPKLRDMAASPLLLTMMALVLYNRGSLPRDRPQLYEAILELLLGEWDKVHDGRSLAEVIGKLDWGSQQIRPVLNELSYEAHRTASSSDGRGRIVRATLRDSLIEFFKKARLPDYAAAAERCLDYFVNRSGLIVPDESEDSYVFAHLTLQEHCAGCHMVVGLEALPRVMEHRGDDRWREPIMLGLGIAQAQRPELIEQVLRRLIDANEDGRARPAEGWQRDLILAAEIGVDREWDLLRTQSVSVDDLQHDLRLGLVDLLADADKPLPVAERVRAGFLLGDLGDPRFPVTIEQWRREIERVLADDPSGYFCRVAAGEYTIGSDDDPDAGEDEKPKQTMTFDAPLWIARYPVTNAQWQVWVESGGRASYYSDDSDLNHPNQPVVGVSWEMSTAFCEWLSETLGTTVRLPSEFEWEAAARGGDSRRYPWGDEWQEDRAAMEEDREIRGWRWSVPVGCYPAGAAPCGAVDMAGNVWEWTADVYRSYPGAKKPFEQKPYRVLRGGHYGSSRTDVRCGARNRIHPDLDYFNYGLRLVVAPKLAL